MGVCEMAKNIVCNVRLSGEERYALRMAALKNKITVQDMLYQAVKDYIDANNINGDTVDDSKG